LFNKSTELEDNVEFMTRSYLRNSMQIVLFETITNKLYGINISKIQSFIIKDEIEITKTPSANGIVIGVINLRGEIITVVNFDAWSGEGNPGNEDEYKIIIVCNYNERKIAILAKEILKIEEKSTNMLKVPSGKDPKISYVVEVEIENKKSLCIIFDAEKLLYDINSEGSTIYDVDEINIDSIVSDKMVLIAEDSVIVREKLKEFFNKLNIKYEIYENGSLLINRLKEVAVDKIGIIVTDIEMPVMGGRELIELVRSDSEYDEINIIVHTNMSNDIMKEELLKIGAKKIIGKVNMLSLAASIEELASL